MARGGEEAATAVDLTAADYRALAAFRYELRRFLRVSEQLIRAAGLEPQHYLLLLALRALPAGEPATIGHLAERLQIAHHSAVGLIDRAVRRGLVRRARDTGDRRRVLLQLTAEGEAALRALALRHREALRAAAPDLMRALGRLLAPADDPGRDRAGAGGAPRDGAR